MDTILLKLCKTCKQTKPVDAFGNDKSTPDGKRWQCKKCSSKAWQEYLLRHPEYRDKRKIYSPDYRAKNKERIAKRMVAYDAKRKAEGKREHQLYPDRVRERLKKYYHEHIDEFQAYREANKEKIKEQTRRYAEENAEKIRAYQIAHREETKARGREWTRTFPEKNAAKEQRRRARKQGLPHTWTQQEIDFMLRYWHNSCAICSNQRGLFWSLAHDHWIPVTNPNCPGTVCTNMIPLCHGDGGCNNSKSDTDPHVWLVRRFGAKKAAKIEQAITVYFTLVAATFPSLTLTGD